MLTVVFLLLISLSESINLKKRSSKYADKLANKLVNSEKKRFNAETCRNSTESQCFLCKDKVIEDEEYCDHPTTVEQRCMCRAAKHMWRTMYENVEDKLQTVAEACSFVCDIKKINETIASDNSTAKAEQNITEIIDYQNGTITKQSLAKKNSTPALLTSLAALSMFLLFF
ncbi:hypothetical protein EIN_381290 [Entamoeba invadens IP1]|uniref:Uncharacterized protein n=1 Tax=Entamoeba invadens IP1 TaxID=370355 RepID=A0A0A1UAS4_ENTIV|nr:hypothetical protein EIN_381290 [Entamoeba invadens IP1]ELP92162.1 hypothetical protein EIN_381290 [Entamoeba invadens IP1]|eukprot:XP_004258933.1 hypothetical protein EIN_381290 [Entamoeba invadens IP1]